MYKKVKQYGLTNGLAVDEKAGLVYGLINGYFVLIQQQPGADAAHIVHLWAKPSNNQPVPPVTDYLNQAKSKFEYLQVVSYDRARITAKFQGIGFQWGTKYVPCLDAFLREATGYCQNNGLLPCCEACGTELGLNLYQVDSDGHMLCPSCYSNVNGQIQQDAMQKKQQGNGNLIGGIIGAILGSLLGIIVWVLIYQLGYISVLGGLAMIFFTMKGYELLGGRLNVAGITITCIISILMLYFAEQICLTIEIYRAYNDTQGMSVTLLESFQSIPYFMSNTEFKNAVIQELFIGYVVLVLGAFGIVKSTYKKNVASISTRMVAPVTKGGPDNINS